ncbi:MAG: hypothetical protein PVJ03_03090 [Chromatiaceae bacterium]|jgi:hypothetical protein
MPHIIVDPDSTALQERCALIQTRRKTRKRFSEGCVEIVASEDDARSRADAASNLHAAIVYGPSVSSENQRIYYLVRWL